MINYDFDLKSIFEMTVDTDGDGATKKEGQYIINNLTRLFIPDYPLHH